MSKTSQTRATRRPTQAAKPAPVSRVDTSNLSPGAAARYHTLIRSIAAFTEAVHNKSLTLRQGK